MTKRKKRKSVTKRKTSQKVKNSNKKLIAFLLFIITILILAIVYLIYIIDTQKLKKDTKSITKVEKTIEKNLKNTHDEFDKYFEQIEQIKKDKFEEYTKNFYKEYDEKPESTQQDTQIDKKTVIKKDKPIQKMVFPENNNNKPKLAIIIDDVTTSYQIKQIQSIGFKTTLSFMPPTPQHNNSAEIAQELPFYMIHLPMEAKYFKNEEKNTLHVDDSYEKIEKRVAQIRKWYPNAKFTNNHTGSKFTSNEEAMDKLFKALKKYDFIFVDSRTIGKSMGKKMAKKYNMPYISRNVFLDNEQNFEYIQSQLKKAISIAKKNGFAIAICHPHQATIDTLKRSKDLLKGVDLIYLKDLPILNR